MAGRLGGFYSRVYCAICRRHRVPRLFIVLHHKGKEEDWDEAEYICNAECSWQYIERLDKEPENESREGGCYFHSSPAYSTTRRRDRISQGC